MVTPFHYNNLGELPAPLIYPSPTRQRAWKELICTPIGIPLSMANWGCLKGTIWSTRRWGQREEGTWGVPSPKRGFMPASPTQANPLVAVDRPSDTWEDYNYKSLAAVSHTPGWNGTPVAGNRGGRTAKSGAYRLRFWVTKGYVLPRPAHPTL